MPVRISDYLSDRERGLVKADKVHGINRDSAYFYVSWIPSASKWVESCTTDDNEWRSKPEPWFQISCSDR